MSRSHIQNALLRRRFRVRQRGFSLLEVIVAFVILGLFLVTILSGQGGLSASNKKAQNMGLAIHYGRCKMTELEEQVLRLGYPELDDLQSGLVCCENDTTQKYTCDTRVEKVLLPDPNANRGLVDGGFDLGVSTGLADGGLSSGSLSSFSPSGLGNLAGIGDGGFSLDLDAGLSGLGSSLSSATGGMGASGLLNMVMGIVYPSFKPMFEASIRRLTVTVHWNEGQTPKDLVLMQYITNPQKGGLLGSAIDAGDPSATGGSGGAAGSGSTTPSTASTGLKL